MSTSKHTPGPWIYDTNVAKDYFPVYTPKGALIAEINYPTRVITGLTRSMTEEERIEPVANAKLIAAAPDLLENLKNIIWSFQGKSDLSNMQKKAIEYANEAIKKAL
jgi:hypothetical protein